MSEWKNPGRVEVGQLWMSPPGEGIPELDHVVAVDGCVATTADGSTIWTEAMLTRGDDYRCVGLEIDGRRFMVGDLIEIGVNVARVEAVRPDSALLVTAIPQRYAGGCEVRLLPEHNAFVSGATPAHLNGIYELVEHRLSGVRWSLRRPVPPITVRPIQLGEVLFMVDGVALRRTGSSLSGNTTWTDGRVTVARLIGDTDNMFRETVRAARRSREAVPRPTYATAEDLKSRAPRAANEERLEAVLADAGLRPAEQHIPFRSLDETLNLATATGKDLDELASLCGIDAERFRREAPRREIDTILAEDARCHPEFATARKAAVVSAETDVEGVHLTAPAAACLLAALLAYEDARGGGSAPDPGARYAAFVALSKAVGEHGTSVKIAPALDVPIDRYERARGCR